MVDAFKDYIANESDGRGFVDIGGDLNDMWGMHLIDANVAMGDIVDLVATQGQSYTG